MYIYICIYIIIEYIYIYMYIYEIKGYISLKMMYTISNHMMILKEFEIWAPPGPAPRYIMQITLHGCSEFQFWRPPDRDPRYIKQITFSEPPTSTNRPHNATGTAKIGRPTSYRRLQGGGGDSPQASSIINN